MGHIERDCFKEVEGMLWRKNGGARGYMPHLGGVD